MLKIFVILNVLFLLCNNLKAQPNLVFILTDEQRYDTSIHYGNDKIITPNLNKLGEEAIVFENAYVAQPVCSPNRSSILTGLYPHQTGVTQNKIPLNDNIATFPQLLGDGRYKTAYIGKWHLGKELDPSHGFDKMISMEDGYHWKEDAEAGIPSRYSDYHKWLIEKGYKPDSKRRGTFSRNFCTNLPYEHTKSSFIEEKAVEFFDDNKGNPFVLYLGFLEPHTPVNGPFNDLHDINDIELDHTYGKFVPKNEPLRNKIIRINETSSGVKLSLGNEISILKEQMKKYWGLVHQVDLSVGKILRKLRLLGLDKNTIVVFTSEHGRMMGKFGISPKRFMYEASSRIPLMIKVPGYNPRKIKYPVSQIDIVPTLLKCFGKPIPSFLPGKSLLDFTSSNVFIEWNTDFSEDGKPTNGKNYDDCPQNREDCRRAMMQNIRTIVTPNGLKLSLSAQDFDLSELYDLKNDPEEKNNLYYNPIYKDSIEYLRKKIIDWQEKVDDKLVL